MLEKLKNNISFKDKTFASIGILMADQPVYEIVLVNKEADKLDITKRLTINDLATIKEHVPTSVPVLLHFSGKGILHKKVSAKGNYLKEVLFNASLEDFYSYELHQSSNAFVSIARKEALNPYFETFKKEKYLVLDYSLGPFVGSLLNQMIAEISFISDDCELIFEDGKLNEFRKIKAPNTSYKIDKDKITNSQIPLFATVLNHLFPAEHIQYDKAFLKSNSEALVYKNIFDKVVMILGIFFLVALLLSYLLLNHYNAEYINYESQLYNLNHTYSQVKELEKEKNNKARILQESGALNAHFLSFYVHEIANSVPNEISLNTLKVNPNLEKIKQRKKIILSSNLITIVGNTHSSIPLNLWVKALKQKKWIKRIEILNYSNTKQKGAQFSLKIEVK